MYKIIQNTLKVMEANEKYLTKLDADIGDADHGINMVRGFKLANERIQQLSNPDVGALLNTTGMALLETVGGAAGPLYGMMYMRMASVVKGKAEIDKKDILAMLEAGLKAVQNIGGGAQPGEKTMVDTLHAAIQALKEVADREDVSLEEALEKAVEAARRGMESTIPMLAKWGRASYLGERSIGHQDPGATSTFLILHTMLATLRGYVGLKVTKYSDEDGSIIEEEPIKA